MEKTLKVGTAFVVKNGVEKVCHEISATIEYDAQFKPDPLDIGILTDMISDLNKGVCPECGTEIERYELANQDSQPAAKVG